MNNELRDRIFNIDIEEMNLEEFIIETRKQNKILVRKSKFNTNSVNEVKINNVTKGIVCYNCGYLCKWYYTWVATTIFNNRS